MNELLALLSEYITALDRAAASAALHEQEVYRVHRSAAAEIEAALRRADARELKRLIDQETHGFGWGFLEGPQGAATEAAFGKFAYRARMSGATFAA